MISARRAASAAILATALATALLVADPAGAALPPVYQRQREIAAVVDSQDVARALRGHPIEAVEFVGEDLYRVKAGTCAVDVRIVGDPLPAHMVGPRRFHVEVGNPVCR